MYVTLLTLTAFSKERKNEWKLRIPLPWRILGGRGGEMEILESITDMFCNTFFVNPSLDLPLTFTTF